MALIFLSLYVVADSLSNVTRGVELSLLSSMTILGAIFGITLAWLRLSGYRVALLATLVGLFLILLRVGRIEDQLGHFALAVLLFAASLWSPWYSTVAGLEGPRVFSEAWTNLTGVLQLLLARLSRWVTEWASGEPTFDPVVAALLWTAVIWTVGWWAGWVIQRKQNALLALTPPVALLAIVLGGLGAKPGPLLWSLGISILVIVVVPYELRRNWWRRSGIGFPGSQRRNVMLWAGILAIALVLAGAVSQHLTYRRLVQFVEDLTSESSSREGLALQAVGLEQREQGEGLEGADLERIRTPGLPRRHLIGSGPELSEQLALMVRIQEQDRRLQFEAGAPVYDYYWRSNSYDIYTGRGWETSEIDTIEYAAGDSVANEIPPTHQIVTQTVRTVPELGGLLFAAGDLLKVDQKFRVDWRSPDDAFGAVMSTTGTKSTVDSTALDVESDELRKSGSQYPDWALETFLALPENLPARVSTLARNLTATAATPYDRAVAIEGYLREYEYSLDLEAPPPNRDIVDYFLFDLGKGYCDYFASSMVVLARAAGPPGSRWGT